MKANTRKITGIAMLTAIVVALQVVAVLIRPTGLFNISLVLVPIVVGSALYGWKAGAWLGFVFGVTVLATDSSAFLAVSVPGTVVTVLLKGILAGLCAGLAYKLTQRINKYLAVGISAVICPIVNTGVFLLGCRLFFMDFITGLATQAGYPSAGKYLIFVMVGVNFLIEMGINIVLSPVIVRIVDIGKKEVK